MKKNRHRSLLCLLLMLALSTGLLFGCSQKKDEQKVLNVGTNAEFPPFEYIDEEGEIDGFDVAVMQAIGEEMGYTIRFTNMEFKSLTASLKTGGLDAVAAGMTITDERKQTVDFSDGYYEATQCIVVPKDSSIGEMTDLEGKQIAVQEGTTGDLMVTPGTDDSVLQNATVKRFKKGSDAIIELKNGGVDAVVIDQAPAERFVSLNQDTLTCIKDNSSNEVYGIAVAKGNTALLNDINEGLSRIKENGTFDKLFDEYINGNTQGSSKTSDNVFMNFIYKLKYVFVDTKGYQLLAKGLGVTLGISFATAIFGIILGFIVALMKLTEVHKKRKTILSRIAGFYIDILRGTPVMVQLLIIYMVLFQNKFGVLAAIITFGINSGAYVAEIIRAGILAVDFGQMEGGRSLGFTYGQTMRYIIVPQAIKNILPALGNELITLVKETSIVGYVAIADLTKASDFIISRTYETFLPLIAIALIYYIVIKIMSKGLGVFERRLRQSDNR